MRKDELSLGTTLVSTHKVHKLRKTFAKRSRTMVYRYHACVYIATGLFIFLSVVRLLPHLRQQASLEVTPVQAGCGRGGHVTPAQDTPSGATGGESEESL